MKIADELRDKSNIFQMEAVRKLLMETKLSIDDVAFSVGFDFVSNFNYSFKKHFGFIPGYLRKK